MPTAFSPRIIYSEDWRYLDGVESATLVQRKDNGETVAEFPVKVLREARAPASVRYLWPVDEGAGAWEPKPQGGDYGGDAIVLEATESSDDRTPTLVITEVEEHATGPYLIRCMEALENE